MSLYSDNSWPRLEKVITWSKMSTNRFAKYIGLSRAESIYQIERGKYDMSRKLAETIVKRFPEISISWLLTGVGEMFVSELDTAHKISYYNLDVESSIRVITSIEPESKMVLPSDIDADFAMVYRGDAMGSSIPTNTIVILKQILSEQVIFGKEYLVTTPTLSSLRVVRRAEGGNDALRLVAIATDKYDDLIVRVEDIDAIYQVAAKLIVNY